MSKKRVDQHLSNNEIKAIKNELAETVIKSCQDEFAQAMIKAFVAEGEKPTCQPEHFRIVLADGAYLNLGNAFNESLGSTPKERAEIIRLYVRFVVERAPMPDDLKSVAPNLMLSVYDRFSLIESNQLNSQIENETPKNRTVRILGDHFATLLVCDSPIAMFTVFGDKLADWKTTSSEAHNLALQNLANRSRENFIKLSPGLLAGPWMDGYTSSRLLLLDKIRQQRLDGDPVVLIPNRDALLLTGSKDIKGLSNMARIGTKGYDQPRRINGIALRLAGNEWVPYLPDRQHPAYEAFNNLRNDTLEINYAAQRTLLMKLNDLRLQETLVASYSTRTKLKTNETYTICNWNYRFEETLLPKTDYVRLVLPHDAKDKGVPVCPWDKLVHVCGDFMERQNVYPERYLMRRFPSDAQIAALKKVAVNEPPFKSN